jgi:hypothetical protein
MRSLFGESAWLIYAALNLGLACVLVAGAAAGGGSFSELPYVMLLFAICSSPIPFIDRWNGAFAMLGVIMAVYFLTFGMADAASMFFPPKSAHPEGVFIDGGEAMLLVGTFLQLIGFHFGVRIAGSRAGSSQVKDWPRGLFLPLGLSLWSLGSAALLYHALFVQVENTNAAVTAGFAKLGIWNTTGLILMENYAGPLGIIILSYWWTRWAKRGGSVLMLAIILAQFAIGWVVDQKEIALSAPAVMLLTRFIISGRVPTRWLVCSILGIVLVFPVLTAKRVIMQEGLGVTRAQALSRTGEILMRAIAERDVARVSNKYEQKTQSFLERATDKAAVQAFAAHVGVDHPYKMGTTFEPLLYVFIPRLVWSDKPGDSSAQLFNREFNVSADRDTYISPTHIGELYWNFGIAGVVIGMTLIGILLGFICKRFDPSTQTSITGVLIIIVTLYELVVRRGGQIEVEYVVWLRTVALIGLLHLIFARRQPSAEPPAHADSLESHPHGAQALPFPNLLR